jgi:hypothetical protein
MVAITGGNKKPLWWLPLMNLRAMDYVQKNNLVFHIYTLPIIVNEISGAVLAHSKYPGRPAPQQPAASSLVNAAW